jgi:transposase-like protein/IS1 family transposase
MGSFQVILATCTHESVKKHGKDYKGAQRFRCKLCGETWIEERTKPLGNMQITVKQATTALHLLLEGCSIRSVSRVIGLNRNTIGDLILTVGENCQRLLDAKVVGVKVNFCQVDELWSFIGMKEKTRVATARSSEWGDSWTFIGLDEESKLVLAHHIGQRDTATCNQFLRKLDRATAGRFQLSTDGLQTYRQNVPYTLGTKVDFAVLIKNYAASQTVTRYSPAKIINSEKMPMFGNPEWDKISTSHIERFNLTVRMTLRRFTRLTNAHSKSLKHHVAMQSIFVAFYNFCRKHESLKGQTPAMAGGLTDNQWTILRLLDFAAGY